MISVVSPPTPVFQRSSRGMRREGRSNPPEPHSRPSGSNLSAPPWRHEQLSSGQRDRDRALLAKSHAGALSGPALSHSLRTKRRAGPVGPPMDARDLCGNHIHTDRPSGRDPQMRRPRSRPRAGGGARAPAAKSRIERVHWSASSAFSMIARIASSFSLSTCLNWHQPEGVPKRRRVAANKRFG